MMNRGKCWLFRLLVCSPIWLVGLVTVSQVRAVDIVLSYDAALSEPPRFDADASRLTALMNSAATVFEDIIEDNWTLNLAYTWGDLGDDGTLGVEITRNTRTGKPTDARVRFNTNDAVDWFIDSTPDDHSEFDLRQTLVRDLSQNDRAASFMGNPPELMEVGFAGVRRSAAGTTDLYSVVLHEMGHAMGLSSVVIGRETNDGDFDVPQEFVNGAAVGIEPSTSIDIGHLAAPRTMMFPIVIDDIRRLPGATDIFAIAAAAGWEEIDLPRQDFLDGGSWTAAENWEGSSIPDSQDTAFLRHGGMVTLDENISVGNVLIAESTELRLVSNLSAVDFEIEDASLHLDGGKLMTEAFSMGAESHVVLTLAESFSGIQVDERTTLSGTLVIESAGTLGVGRKFTLFQAAGIDGQFGELRGIRLGRGLGLAIEYLDDRVVGTIALIGDSNLDGTVDFADFLTISNNFGRPGMSLWHQGDFTGDQQTTFDDFLAMSQAFGTSVARLAAPVPEPSGLSCMCLVTLLSFSCRRHRNVAC